MEATIPACRAVVAVRRHAPERTRRLLRRLRVRHFAGSLLDEPATLHDAAEDAGVDPADLDRWTAEPETEVELREDMAAAREPLPRPPACSTTSSPTGPAAAATPARPTRSCACPTASASPCPGFQPFAVYDVLLANLVPGLDRREPPATVAEVLAWTGTPLATREVAVVRDISHADAREQLGRVAVERHVGADGFWTLDGSPPAL